MKHKKKKNRFLGKGNDFSAYLFIAPSMIIVTLFIIYPVIWSFIASFKSIKLGPLRTSGLFEIPGKFVGLSNYTKAFHNQLFIKSLFNTAYFALIFIPLTIIASIALAILLDRKMNGVNFMRTVFFIPYVISIISASLIFKLLFNGETGMINLMISKIGLTGPNWLSSSIWAMPVIAIMSSWRRIGYFMIIYLAGLQNISKTLYEAAAIDGATPFQTFKKIIWPLLGRITLVIMILLIISSLNVFQEVFVMTGGGPADSTVTVPFLIYNSAFKYYKIGQSAAMSYILFMIVGLITFFRNRSVNKKLG